MFLGEARRRTECGSTRSATSTAATTMLAEVHERIAADLAARPVADHRIIHIGDYVDRGPDSAAVDRAAGWAEARRRARDMPARQP